MTKPPAVDHQHNNQIGVAVQWLRNTPREARPGAAIPQLRARFGLTAAEACRALAEHHLGIEGR